MKIYLEGTGDRSVGINPVSITIEVNIDDFDGERDAIREDLGKYFSGLFDDKIRNVWFEDECPDCLQKRVDDKCVNKSCINNNIEEV